MIICGTYSGGLIGYMYQGHDVSSRTEKNTQKILEPKFAYESHIGCVKCVRAMGNRLVSGGSDEHVKLYNISQCSESGALIHHKSTVTCLDMYGLPNGSHVLTGDDTGVICVWKCCNWELVHQLKGHKKGVIDCRIHPSGKLALSVSKDGTFKMWDLMLGTCAMSHALDTKKGEPLSVRYSADGDFYFMLFSKQVSMVEGTTATSQTICANKLFTAMEVIATHGVIVGESDGSLHICDTKEFKVTNSLKLHEGRVKGMGVVEHLTHAVLVVTACSEGVIVIWEIELDDGHPTSSDPKQLKLLNTQARLTCLATCSGPSPILYSEIRRHKIKKEKLKMK